MLAVYAASQSADNPLSGLEVGERPDPQPRPGWTTVTLRAASLNHHDVWSLRGVGLPADRLPMVLGCDGAGVDEDGNEVIVHAVVPSDGWHGDETLDPRRTLLSELHDGTLAEKVAVPRANLVPKPAALSFEHAACLSTAWLTAYRMLFTNAGLTPGATVLVQGAGGGVATALIQLGSAAGYRMWATSRDEGKRAKALQIGAEQAFESGVRLPERVDAVMETVGAATWSHSVNSLKPGGAIVISGATSGDAPAKAELTKVFFKQLRVIGSTMGNRLELERLAQFVVQQGIEPVVDTVLPLEQAREGFAKMASGDLFGKVVFTIG
jgi:NADPH:quinone reductase-like Zn-dependent oxidoreductase